MEPRGWGELETQRWGANGAVSACGFAVFPLLWVGFICPRSWGSSESCLCITVRGICAPRHHLWGLIGPFPIVHHPEGCGIMWPWPKPSRAGEPGPGSQAEGQVPPGGHDPTAAEPAGCSMHSHPERCLHSAPLCPGTSGAARSLGAALAIAATPQPKPRARSCGWLSTQAPWSCRARDASAAVSGGRAAGVLQWARVPPAHEMSQHPPERVGSLLPRAGPSLSCSARNVLSDLSSLLPSIKQRVPYLPSAEVLGGRQRCCHLPGLPGPLSLPGCPLQGQSPCSGVAHPTSGRRRR